MWPGVRELALTAALAALGACSSGGGVVPDPVPAAVQLTWTPSDVAEDGSPVTDLSAYRVEWRNPSESWDSAVKLTVPPEQTQYVLSLPSGEWQVSVVAVSASRGEARSNEVAVLR